MLLYQLEYFVTIADCKSINKAAERLFVSQSSLSKTIKNLETELGFPVLFRNHMGVTMTEMGEKLYAHAKMMLEQKEMINCLSMEAAPHTLTIASYPFFSVPKLYGEFHAENHERRDISFQLIECRLKEVIERVEDGSADIGVLVYNSGQCKDLRHMLYYKGLELTELVKDTWYVNVGPKNPLFHQEVVAFQDLAAYSPVRMPDDYFSNLTSYLEVDGMKIHKLKNTIYVNDCAAILSILQSTTAFRLGPGFSRPELEGFGIRSIPIQNCQVAVYAGWICRKDKMLTEDEKAFVEKLNQLKARACL